MTNEGVAVDVVVAKACQPSGLLDVLWVLFGGKIALWTVRLEDDSIIDAWTTREPPLWFDGVRMYLLRKKLIAALPPSREWGELERAIHVEGRAGPARKAVARLGLQNIQ